MRSLKPLDMETIRASLSKTHKARIGLGIGIGLGLGLGLASLSKTRKAPPPRHRRIAVPLSPGRSNPAPSP